MNQPDMGNVQCSGGVDWSNRVESRACTIPLPVPAWVPVAVVAGFIGLLAIALVVIVVLYLKFRDVSNKYKQFVDEDENGTARRKETELRSADTATE